MEKNNTETSHCDECIIQNRAICNHISKKDISYLSQNVHGLYISKGENLFSENSEDIGFYSVLEGGLSLHKNLPDGQSQILGFALPGDFIGLTHKKLRNCTATALIENTRICKWPFNNIDEIIEKMPNVAKALLHQAVKEIDNARDHILFLGSKSAEKRVAWFLHSLFLRTTDKDSQNLPLPKNLPLPQNLFLPMSRQDIGDYLGLTKETVCREMTKLKKSEIIEAKSPHYIRILDDKILQERSL